MKTRTLRWPLVTSISNLLSSLFGDQSLTKKASLNAVTTVIDYAAQTAVALVLTPLLVNGLGHYFYGMWQFLNRIVGYMTPTSGQPTTALKYSLANQQASTDYEYKRHLVGSAIAVWVIFLPLLGLLGGILAWFIPIWLTALPEHVLTIRLAAILLVSNLAVMNLAGLPLSILQGENLGYKRILVSAFLIILSGVFTWTALSLHLGLPGVAAAALTGTVITGSVMYFIMRGHISWAGIARPRRRHVLQFLGLSGWFWAWNTVASFMMDSDVVVLGFFNSMEIITVYTLNKYVPDAIISMIVMVVIGVVPGLGGIIGSGDMKRASAVRNQIMAITWLIATAAGTTILLWNRAFISLWVGPELYAGLLPSLLIIISLVQFVMIRNDANFIDLTLNLRTKVLMGSVSVVLTVLFCVLFYGYLQLGISGLCAGLILGRLVLSIAYPFFMGRFLGDSFSRQLGSLLRPVVVTAILFSSAMFIQPFLYTNPWVGIRGWIGFLSAAGLSALLIFAFAFYGGLTTRQRARLIERARLVVQKVSDT
jgi:O-antigen/teichoic acid export membrane protein